MKTARRYDTKLPCPACGHLQSQNDKAALYISGIHRVAWGDFPSDDDWVTDYMPHCNGCGVHLETGDQRVRTEYGYVHHWYWIARLLDK